MPALFRNVLIFSIEEGEGKNGFWANVTLLNMKSKKKVELFLNDEKIVKRLKEYSENEIEINVEVEVIQNKFGTRLGAILSIEE